MRFPPMAQLETPRLILRRLRTSDLEHYHTRLTSDPEVARYMLWQPNSDLSHTASVIERRLAEYAAGKSYHWAIARREDDALIGTIALLRFDESEGSCSFAYMLGQDFWGQGFGTEALRAVLGFAFREMEISAVSADHFADNPASGAAMRKAGMRPVCLLPRQYEKEGVFHDAVLYSMTRQEWETQHG